MTTTLGPLYARMRPTTFAEVVGQEKCLRRLEIMRQNTGFDGRAFFMAAPSGTGKTTIARLIAGDVADPMNDMEVDATGLAAAAIVETERSIRCYGMGEKTGRAVIINEAHGLNKAAVRQLLTTLERIPSHCCWIFTTTDDGAESLFDGIDAHPLLSRCIELPMSRRPGARLIAERLRIVAQAEGLDGQGINFYVELVKQNRNDWRGCYQFIESGGCIVEEAV